MPNSSLRKKSEATLALWMMFLLGRQAILGHAPPTYLRSMTTTRWPFCAEVHAITLPAAPLPKMTRSYSSGLEPESPPVFCVDSFINFLPWFEWHYSVIAIGVA